MVSDSLGPHVHQVSLSINNSHSLSNSCPLSWWCHPTTSPTVFISSCLQSFPGSESIKMRQLLTWGNQSYGVSAWASILAMNIQDWFPLGWTGWIYWLSKGFSRVFSNTKFKSINSSVLNFLYSSTLTSIHDYWRNHSFDWMNLCWQSTVCAF